VEEQHGFLKGHACTDCIFILTRDNPDADKIREDLNIIRHTLQFINNIKAFGRILGRNCMTK
jgi:hypothetical protein